MPGLDSLLRTINTLQNTIPNTINNINDEIVNIQTEIDNKEIYNHRIRFIKKSHFRLFTQILCIKEITQTMAIEDNSLYNNIISYI